MPDANGEVHVPDAPGLGMVVDLDRLQPYLRDVRITVDGAEPYTSRRGPAAVAGSMR